MGCTLEFDRIHLKEAIVMWPDMHSFLEFDKFEPISNFKFLFEKLITCFVLAIWQTSIVRRFWNLTDSERFWLEFCQIPKTTNKKHHVSHFGSPFSEFDKIRAKNTPNLLNSKNDEQLKFVKSLKRSTWSIFRREIKNLRLVRIC